MPLKLDLKTGEKMIVNGAVLENVGPGAKVIVHNMASILRDKEILTQDDAVTPASRVYFSLQCAYMFPETRDGHLKKFRSFLNDYLAACPSALAIGDEIKGFIDEKQYYKALRASRNLIAHEAETVQAFNSGMTKLNEIAQAADTVIDMDQLIEENADEK